MVSGVVGGMIDVNGLVSQLMEIERQPLNRLQQRETQIQSRLSAFGRVTGAMSALDSALNALSLAKTFTTGKATVNGEGVSAAVSGAPALGRYAVAVTQLARAQSTASATFDSATTDIGTGTVTVKSADGKTTLATINIGDTGTGTLTELRDEINAAGIGVTATLVNDGAKTRIVLASKETGAANGFQISTSKKLDSLAFATTQAAQDAKYSINGLALTASSNTVENAIEGLTLTLTKAPPPGSPAGTTIDGEVVVEPDADRVKTAVQDFVKAYNDVEKLIAELTKYDPGSKTAAVLNGESVLRQVQGMMRGVARGAMSAATGDFSRLSEIGVSVQTDGTLKIDDTKLADLATADPAKLSRLFTATSAIDAEQGFAVRLRAAVKSIIEPAGTLQSRQEGLRASIKSIDQQQERLEARLATIEQRLRRQYSQLDALMTSRQSQSNALANALAGLPSLQR